MKKEKVLIYDFTKGFSRFVKHYLSYKYDFDVIVNKKGIQDIEILNYLAVIMIINDYIDLIDFLNFQLKTKNIIVSCDIKAIALKLNELDNVILLDLSKIKKEVLIDINSNLEVFSTIKDEMI